MFADDLIVLAPNETETASSIAIVKEESDNLKMKLNPRKSGILRIGKIQANQIDGDIDGIPIVTSYKYLGTVLNSQLTPTNHLQETGRKADFQTHKLSPLRRHLDLRFNVSLFKMLIMPGIRLLGCVYKDTSITEQKKIEINMRRRVRSFCLLPWTSPNELTEVLVGDTAKIMDGLAKAVDYKRRCRQIGCLPRKEDMRVLKQPIRSHIPRRLTRLVQMMYGSKCKHHPSDVLNRHHLREAHGNYIDPVHLIKNCV